MKKLITTGVVLTMALGTFGVNAGDLSASAGLDLNSAYIFRGATVNDEVNLNPSTAVDLGNGISVGTWGNFNTDTSDFDEVDLTASYALPLGDGAPAVALGYTEYLYPNSSGTAVDATGNITNTGATSADREVSLSTDIPGGLPLNPSIGVYLGVDGAIDEQLYIELKGGHKLPINGDLALDLGATLGYIADEGSSTGDTGLSHLTLSASTGFGPATVGVSYVVETDDKVLAVDEDFFVTVGVKL